jgi:protoporphyrinogen oxidase
MDIDWLSKIPRLDLETIVRNCLERNSGRDAMPSHEGFYYPKSGGFQRIFDALFTPLAHKVILNEGARKIAYEEGLWEINHKYRCEVLINTAPWPGLYPALGEPAVLAEHFERLVSNSITVTLWEREHGSSAHWIYEPSLDIAHHREFYIRNFAPHSKPSGVYTETNTARVNREFPQAGVTAGSPALYEHTNEEAYPVPVIGHARAIAAIQEYYRPRKLYGLGRWGQWRYMNSDVCIKEAMEFVKNELHLSVS